MFFDNKKELLEFDNKVNGKVIKYLSRKNNDMKCMIEGCNKHAVNSHAISKMSSLNHISEENNLLAIKSKRNSGDKGLKFSQISYNDATTFRGFCNEHEKLFKDIDENGICSKKDLILQCYRNLCHAYFFENLLTVWHPHISSGLKSEQAYTKILENITSKCSNTNTKYIKDNINVLVDRMDEIKYGRLNRLGGYIKEFYYLINNLPESNTILKELDTEKIITDKNCKLDIIFKRVPYCIPVALVNKYTLKFDKFESDIFFSIIPAKESTDIIIIYEKEKNLLLLEYWRKIECCDINILNMVESLMMCGDEQWFIKPSVIKSKPIERVRTIEEDIYCVNERKFLQEYDVSIFDELRLIFVEDVGENRKYNEIRKITDDLNREQFEKRKNKYLGISGEKYMEV